HLAPPLLPAPPLAPPSGDRRGMAESGGVRAISSPSPYASGMARETSATPTLIGLPYDASSSFLRGAAAAPPVIRQALHSPAGNPWTETGVDIGGDGALAKDLLWCGAYEQQIVRA